MVSEKSRMIMPQWLKYNFIKKILPDNVYERLRQVLVFAPDDPNNLHQTPPQRHIEGLDVDRIQGYRYPAPGSRLGARVPTRENSDQLFDTNFATHDPRNLPNTYSVTLNATNSMLLDSTPIRLNQSPGNKNAAVMEYDPSGLRSTMSATWGELDKAVIANAAPDHLPGPEWWKHRAEIALECERKGIPQVNGRRYKADLTPNYNTLRW